MKSFIVSVGLSLAIFAASAAASDSMQCGASGGGQTCPGTLCCSRYGWCGTSNAYCKVGCQSGFGSCSTDPAISNNGKCGGSTGTTCKGSGFGSCCSKNGVCGYSADFCGTGCQSGFGTCSSSSSSSSSKSSSATSSATSSARSSSSTTHSSSSSSSSSRSSSSSAHSSTQSSTASSSSASSTKASSSSASSSASATSASSTPTPSAAVSILTSDPFQDFSNFVFTSASGTIAAIKETDATAHTGTSYVRVSSPGGGIGTLRLSNTTPLTSGTRYSVKVFYRALTNPGGCSVAINIGSNEVTSSDATFSSTSWVQLQGYYTAASGDTAALSFVVDCASPSGTKSRVRRITLVTGLDFSDLSITTAPAAA